jgi:parallel beta-helix repeat protein
LIDDFAGDGIDHSASHIRILRNRITNGHDICQDKCVHNDGIQGWNWHNQPGQTDTDVVIDSNVIIAQTKPNLVLAADDLHGITIFDGSWDGMQISNNLVITSTWHGISAYGVNNLTLINNTVAGTNAKRRTWIAYNPRKGAPPGTEYHGVIIRNNVALDLPREGLSGVEVDHNFRVSGTGDFADDFVKFDPDHFAYDLHPTKRSGARGEGSGEGAPATDIEGKPRGPKVDIGAYAFSPN